jgi:CHAD domain-containing protein
VGKSRAYRLEAGEGLSEGVARIARGRLDHALDELEGKAGDTPEEAVHEARKDMKKLRALLRLARGEIGDETYDRENACFRDAARRLSGVRDADVMLETLDRLAEHSSHALPAGEVRPLRAELERHRGELRGEADAARSATAEVVEVLHRARSRVGEWPLEHEGFEALEGGLRRTYRRGRRAFKAALDEPSDQALHELRKRVKDLWYHLRILGEAWPPVIEASQEEAHALSDRLGDDHDLAVLLAFAEQRGVSPEGLAPAVERRRAELQAEASALGYRLYAERPRAFARRLGAYWSAWRTEPVRI